MDNRDTLLSVKFFPSATTEPFVEADLRNLQGHALVGRRGQLQFTTKLSVKAADTYRQDPSVIQLWADVRVSGPDGAPLPNLGRAVVPDPIFFEPPPEGNGNFRAGGHRDPWTRGHDCLVLDLDFQQVDEFERIRQGGSLMFTMDVGGVVYHGGKVGQLYPDNHSLLYTVGASDWLALLNQLDYGTFVNIEVSLTSPNNLAGDGSKAAVALQEAVAAFRRGEYEEAVADCRPGLEALDKLDQGKFTLKPGDRAASKEERFFHVRRSLLALTHLAHHPNETSGEIDGAIPDRVRWERADAEAVISILASLIQQRIGA